MRELQTGLWHWQAPHPEWTAAQRWPQALLALAREREPVIVLGSPNLDWLRCRVTREQTLERLRPLLRLPVELVLPAHGAVTDRTALERALP